MKTHALPGTLLLGSCLLGWSSAGNAAELTVRLEDPPPTGTVVFVLFDSANTFGDLRDPAKTVRYTSDDSGTYRIRDVPAGEYALLVYHDENENGFIDRSFIGIPKEPLGFSRGYRPKGPPNYSRAAFELGEGETRHFDVELSRPLGDLGRFGIGLGVIARSSPYRGYEGGVYQPIPAVTYTGNRLRIFGPNAQADLFGSGRLRLAAAVSYRIGVYDEDDSSFLEGMGDRKSTLMAGPTMQCELPAGVDLSAGYEHDVLDEIGGGVGRLAIDKSFRAGVFSLSPEIGLNWVSAELSNHDFGVPAESATAARPAYDPGGTFSVEGTVRLFIEVATGWLVVMSAGVELQNENVTDSPIVSEEHIIKGFAAVNYVL
ncbi:MipA/OmpV family protein [Verrucomicrobiota bacterium]